MAFDEAPTPTMAHILKSLYSQKAIWETRPLPGPRDDTRARRKAQRQARKQSRR